jgi:YfiH family protein
MGFGNCVTILVIRAATSGTLCKKTSRFPLMFSLNSADTHQLGGRVRWYFYFWEIFCVSVLTCSPLAVSVPVLETAPLATHQKLPMPGPFNAIFTQRAGGQSKGLYDSLNMALHVGDDPRRVRANRQIVLNACGLSGTQPIIAAQVHGSEVALVTDDDAGRGNFSHADAIEGSDALVTKANGVPLISLSADCLSLVLGDPQAKVLAVLHGGWRGLAAGVIQNTVAQMVASGAKPERIFVAGTPAIGPCCFEVGHDVAAALEASDDCVVNKTSDKVWIDLQRVALNRLKQASIPESQIHLSETCTCCQRDGSESLYFSHRRSTRAGEKHTGRMALVAWM